MTHEQIDEIKKNLDSQTLTLIDMLGKNEDMYRIYKYRFTEHFNPLFTQPET